MGTYEWVGLVIAVPAALILLSICVGSAVKMSSRDASSLRDLLAVAVAVLMLLFSTDVYLYVRSIPVVGLAYELVGFAAIAVLFYSAVVGTVLVFRHRLRGIGCQLVVFAILGIWWSMLMSG